MSTPTQVVAKFRGVATDVKAAQNPGLNAAGLAAKTTMQAAPGAPQGRMRGVGRNGARVGVRYQVFGQTVVSRWFGPAHLVNNPTKAHDILPKKRGKKQAIVIGGHPYARARRGPTRGKHFFEASKPRTEDNAKRAYYGKMIDPVRKRFNG